MVEARAAVAASPVRVIGAGWAGLAAAVTLVRHGVPVAIHEAAAVPGGRARRVALDHAVVDNGLHILLGAYRDTLELARLVSSGPLPVRRLPLQLEVAGRLSLRSAAAPPPLDLLLGLLGAGGLSLGERMRAAAFMVRLRLGGFRARPGETVAALLERLGQQGSARAFLWEPLCVAALNTDPVEADAQVFLNVLRDGMSSGGRDSDLVLPAADLGALFPDPACRWLEARGCLVHLGDPVRTVRSGETGFVVECRSGMQPAAQVICACDPARAAALLEPLPGLAELAVRLRALRFLPISSVYLQYESTRRLPSPMLGLPDGPMQWAFDRGTLCGQPGLLACVASAATPLEGWSRERIAQAAHDQLAAILPSLETPSWSGVINERRATFACVPGLDRPAVRTPLQGFFLAGDYTAGEYPATLEAAVRSGVAAARSALENR